MPQSNIPKARKRRATAAAQAYKKTVSRNGAYSPRAFIKDVYGAKTARVVGKTIRRSAAKPGKVQALLGKPKQRKAAVGPKSDINFTKLGNVLTRHVSFGEAEGVMRDINRRYKRNVRKSKGKAPR